MKKRYIIPLIFLLLLGLGGYWSYNFLKQTVGMGAEAISLVPKDAVFVLETEEPIKNWKDISNSAPWKFLMKNEYYKDLNKSAESLNQLIQENSKLFGDFGSRKVVMSAHVYKPSDYDYLFLIDLENISKVRPLVLSLLEELPGYKLTNRMYKETEFYSLLDTKGKQTLYLTFIDNYVVCSYTHSLVEKSIDQHVDPVIARDQKFVEVQKKVSGDGMFRLYINYQYFDDFMRVYTKSDNTYVKALSNALKYSGMEFEYDYSKALMKLNGYSTIDDETDSYLKLLHKQGSAKMEFAPYVSKRAAIVTSMNVGDFQNFYDELELQLQQKEAAKYADYQEKIKKIERFLRISLKDDFVSWIDDELTFVNTQPVGLGEKNEYALFIKAKSGSEASDKLAKIAKQIKKRTPVRFKGLDYKGYKINFLSVKGLFKLMMGDFFGKIDKPYFTIIDDYVIFSNHPQTIKNIIDDYIKKETLANSEQYKNVVKHLNSENSMLIYVNMPLANNSLKDFLDAEAKKDIAKNKHYFEAFPTFAFQLTANGDGFDTKVLIDYEEQEQLKELKSDFIKDASEKAANNNATSLMSADENGEDSLEISIQDIEEAALIQIDELILEDLDAKIQVENYPSGAIKLEVGLKNGVKNGSYTEYSEDGKVIVKGSFKNDQKTGVWKFYDKNGGLISKKKF